MLAKNGVRIIIPARDLIKAAEVKESIQNESPAAEIILLEMDLSSFASIQKFCSDFLSLGLPLHILMYIFFALSFVFFFVHHSCFVGCRRL